MSTYFLVVSGIPGKTNQIVHKSSNLISVAMFCSSVSSSRICTKVIKPQFGHLHSAILCFSNRTNFPGTEMQLSNPVLRKSYSGLGVGPRVGAFVGISEGGVLGKEVGEVVGIEDGGVADGANWF